jgi:6-pyruvoyltetrahydropterin/6-carboxytetrahydropterin synthase
LQEKVAAQEVSVFEISVRVRFSAGHRLLGYAGKCVSPHGHSYVAEVAIAGDGLDSIGMLTDFGDLKAKVRGWILENWDHAFLVNDADSELISALGSVSDARVYVFSGRNPTAENLAQELAHSLSASDAKLINRVTIWETEEQCATFTVN